jgi:hypothetical protein
MQKGHRVRTSAQRIMRTTIEAECLRLRAKGYTCLEVAEMLGITGVDPEGRVNYIVKAALERKGKPEASQVRNDLYERLDRQYNIAMGIVRKNGADRVAALAAATAISARMSALVGADAPKELDIKDDRVKPIDPAAAAQLVERLAEEARSEEAEGSPGAAAPGAAGSPS